MKHRERLETWKWRSYTHQKVTLTVEKIRELKEQARKVLSQKHNEL